MKCTKFLRLLFFAVQLAFFPVISIFGQDGTNFIVTVSIDYGSAHTAFDTTITSDRPLTALEALEYAAKIETSHVNHYVFVTAIDDVKGIRGNMAWYYEVNNQPSKTIAINNILKNGDMLHWIYKKDVCSIKVDNPTHLL